jgi:hypothetical protein
MADLKANLLVAWNGDKSEVGSGGLHSLPKCPPL